MLWLNCWHFPFRCYESSLFPCGCTEPSRNVYVLHQALKIKITPNAIYHKSDEEGSDGYCKHHVRGARVLTNTRITIIVGIIICTMEEDEISLVAATNVCLMRSGLKGLR